MNSSFQHHLQAAFKSLPSGYTVEVRAMATQPEPFKLFGSSKEHDAQHTKRLLLVSLTPKNVTAQRQFVCGMEVDEFVLDKTQKSVVYISKVDSTGAFPKVRGVAARLVQAYLHAMAPCTVHVFGRSQPQYLFRNSRKHPDKHVLPPRDLIQWWRKVISQTVMSIAHDKEAPFGWWLIPGVEDATSALREIGGNSSCSGWTYGQPYDLAARASDVIPQFLDDTKARVLKSNEDDGNDTMTVQELWQLLAFTEECGSNHHVGFFVAQVPSAVTAASGTLCNEHRLENIVEQEIFTQLWNTLMENYFRNQEEVVSGTRTFVDAWDEQKMSPPVEIVTCGGTSSSSAPTATATATQQPPPANPSPSSSPITINTLSVKRKAVAPATTVVNTLTVKRIKKEQDQIHVLTAKRKDDGK